jgi:hypothetical protein
VNKFRSYFFGIGLTILVLSTVECKHPIRAILQKENSKIKIYIEPVGVKIKINSLDSIATASSNLKESKDLIEIASQTHGAWFRKNLSAHLEEKGFLITEKENANLILECNILDMGEIRKSVFFYSIGFGIITGISAAWITGHKELGLGIFLFEVIEESLYPIILLSFLKNYYLVSTIEIKIKNQEGIILDAEDYTSISNDEFINKLPIQFRKRRENIVRASMDKNAKKISEYLKEETTNE